MSWWLGYFELISNNLTAIKILISGTSECLVDLVEIKLFFVCLCLLLSVFCLYFSHDAWVWNTRYGSSHDAAASISFSEREELLREKKTKPKLGGKTNRREAVSTCWLFQCLFVYPPYRHLPRDLCLWDFFVITLRRQVENGIASRRVFDVLSKRFYWPWLNIAFRRTAYRHSESTSDRQERMEKKREGDEGG